MSSVALVYFNITQNQFFEYTPKEFDKLLQIKADEKENNYKIDMEAMRLQTFYLVNVHLGKKQYKSVNQLMPFAWDEETKNRIKYGTETAEMTDEDWEALDSKYPVGKLKKKEKNG